MKSLATVPIILLVLLAQFPLAYSQDWQREAVNDSTLAAQMKECEQVYRRAFASTDPDVRMDGVDLLTRVCTQSSVQVSGVALRYLRTFDLTDFTPASKENIGSLVRANHPYLKEVIMMSGFLQLRDLVPQLKTYAGPGNRADVRWAAIISLARTGDRDANMEMMARVRRLPVNDEVVYNIFPDLIFSRTPEAISYLVEALHSDATNCFSPDAEREAMIPCAYRVMEQVARVVADFPLELDQSGDLKTTDYPVALATTRQWFRENPNYKIIHESY